jgi:hypothetical protein
MSSDHDEESIRPPKISDLLKAVDRLTHERNALAKGIHDAAVSLGIIQPQSLTGPQLLLLCEDMAQFGKEATK